MEHRFFGRYDLLGHPVYDDIHGRIFIPSTKHVAHEINHIDNGVDLIFHGIDGISELICRLTMLRDNMIYKSTGSTIKPRTVSNKKFPRMQGEFVRWINDIEFIVLIDGKEMLAHKDYWEGDIPAQSKEMKGE